MQPRSRGRNREDPGNEVGFCAVNQHFFVCEVSQLHSPVTYDGLNGSTLAVTQLFDIKKKTICKQWLHYTQLRNLVPKAIVSRSAE